MHIKITIFIENMEQNVYDLCFQGWIIKMTTKTQYDDDRYYDDTK